MMRNFTEDLDKSGLSLKVFSSPQRRKTSRVGKHNPSVAQLEKYFSFPVMRWTWQLMSLH